MQMTWLQLAVPSYSFEYESDRSKQVVTVTNTFYSASIQNHGIERKHSSSSPGSRNHTRSSIE